jgi:hypothetical protein
MTIEVNRFYNLVENAAEQSQSALIELFVYFLTVESGLGPRPSPLRPALPSGG